MKAFHEQSPIKQIVTLLSLITLIGTPSGAIIALAAENYLDQIYQTDTEADLARGTIRRDVDNLGKTVEANTRALKRTVKSVDALTLTVIDLQIHEIEEDVVILEQAKSRDLSSWTTRNEQNLNDRKRSLRDLIRQREILFDRVANNHGDLP